MNILGIDIGGTSVKYCLLNKETKKYQDVESFSTRGIKKNELMTKIANIVNEINPDVVSVSSPGAIIKKEIVSGLTGITNYSNFNFKEELLEKVNNKDLKVFLLNDANAALMSEMNEELDKLDVVLISIGTGIGGAISLKGELRAGNRGLGGEFGYGIVDEEKNVSLASSSRSIETNYKNSFGSEKTGIEILNNYKKDLKCKKVVDEAIEKNAINIFNIFYAFDIDLFIISGGITNSNFFIKKVIERTNQLSNERGAGIEIKIKIAEHKSESGIIGAINYALKNIK